MRYDDLVASLLGGLMQKTEAAIPVAGKIQKQKDVGSFFVFINLFRWLNLVMALILLYVEATPPMPTSVTVAVYGSVFFYNSAFSIWSARIERLLKKYPALIAIDIVFCFLLMLVYGWRSPFSTYSYVTIMMAGSLFDLKGVFLTAAASAVSYGLSVAINGFTWAQIVQMEQIDGHVVFYFDYFAVALFFSYPVVLAKKLRQSNNELIEAQEKIEQLVLTKERRRLAGDMHDSVTQNLLSIGLVLDQSIKGIKDSAISKRLAFAKEAVTKALADIKMTIDDLYEERLSSKSFTEIANRVLINTEQAQLFVVDLSFIGKEPEIKHEVKKELYLILQEAVSNVVKHAFAERLVVKVGFSLDQLNLEVVDDGRGFEQEQSARGHGLETICQRTEKLGGVCKLSSNIGRGTKLMIKIPIVKDGIKAEANLADQMETQPT